MKCELCNREFKTLRSLGLHLSHSHKDLNIHNYYDKYFKKPNEGICIVCGKSTKYKGGLIGYARTCSISCGQKHPDTRLKMSKTNLERYGATNPYGSKEIRNKIKQHNLEKYGVENTFCLPGVNEKAIKNSHSKESEEKRKQTCFKKYGNPYHIASKEIRQKAINTYQKRYGVSNAFSIEEIHKKAMHNSLGRKNDGNDSSWETLLENALISKNINFKKSYNKDSRYPYHCDFYLIDSDTFIEINGYWTHGGHWFDKNNSQDIKKLNEWKSKSNNRLYKSAITTWTISDLKKYNTAKKNKLNYIVLWTLDDIHNYINSL